MTRAEYSLRTFCFPQDYDPVLHLWETAGPGVHVGRSDTRAEIEKKLTRDPELFLVAEVEGQIVGTVLGGFDGRRGIVYHLAVQPEARQLGIGSALMEEVERRLLAKGCLRAYLLVAEGNESVHEFYSARGWDAMPITIFGKNLD